MRNLRYDILSKKKSIFCWTRKELPKATMFFFVFYRDEFRLSINIFCDIEEIRCVSDVYLRAIEYYLSPFSCMPKRNWQKVNKQYFLPKFRFPWGVLYNGFTIVLLNFISTVRTVLIFYFSLSIPLLYTNNKSWDSNPKVSLF